MLARQAPRGSPPWVRSVVKPHSKAHAKMVTYLFAAAT